MQEDAADCHEWYVLQYLQDLECPIPFGEDAVPGLLDWLLHHAVSLEYQDAGGSQRCICLPMMCLPQNSCTHHHLKSSMACAGQIACC